MGKADDWNHIPLPVLRYAWRRIRDEKSFNRRERRLMFRATVYRTLVRRADALIQRLRDATRLRWGVRSSEPGDWQPLVPLWGAMRLSAMTYNGWNLSIMDYAAGSGRVMRVVVALAQDGRARLFRICAREDGSANMSICVLGENVQPWMAMEKQTIAELTQDGKPVFLSGLIDWDADAESDNDPVTYVVDGREVVIGDDLDPVLDERLADELRRLLDGGEKGESA